MDKDIDWMEILELIANKLKGDERKIAVKNINRLKSIRNKINKEKSDAKIYE